jgi:hypothetical protein
VPQWLRDRLTFSNVVSVVALFVALGGTSYGLATGWIGSSEVRDNSLRSRDIRNRTINHRDVKPNGLGGSVIKESRLAKVPRARNADRVGGLTADRLRVRCPSDTVPVSDVCIERSSRPALPYGSAAGACKGVDTPRTPGRRLPTHSELMTALGDPGISLAQGGELTAEVYPSSSSPGQVDVLAIVTPAGGVALTPDTFAGRKSFRCVTDPLN